MVPIVIYGEDRISAKNSLDSFCKHLQESGFNVRKIYGDIIKDTTQISNAAQNSPLFKEKTALAILYLYENSDKTIQEAIINIAKISKIPFIFFEPTKESLAIKTAQKNPWKLVHFPAINKRNIPKWTYETAQALNLKISREFSFKIAEILEYNEALIYQALRKIATIEEKVDYANWEFIKKLIWSETEIDIWNFVESLFSGNFKNVKNILENKRIEEELYIRLLHAIYLQYRRLLIFQSCMDSGMPTSEAIHHSVIPRFALYRFEKASRFINAKKTAKILKEIIEIEKEIKSGEITPYMGIIKLISLIILISK